MMMRKYISFFFRQDVIVGFVWTTLGYAFLYALIQSHYTNAFVAGLTFVFTLIPLFLRHRYQTQFPRGIMLFAVFFAYASLFLGEIHNFYERFWWWDVILHGGSAIVFGLIGLGVVRMMVSADKVQAIPSVVSFLSFAFALSIGTLWEVTEFVIDFSFQTTMQDASLVDTMSDLIVDSLGALIVVLFAYLHWKYPRTNVVGRTIDDFIKQQG